MSKRLAIELLQKYSNPPSHCNSQELDDDGVSPTYIINVKLREDGRTHRLQFM